MYGEYQTASIEFDNTALADLSRLVPLDSDASGIPEAILLNTATNKQNRSVPVTVIGSMCNLLCDHRAHPFRILQFPRCARYQKPRGTGARNSSLAPPSHVMTSVSVLTGRMVWLSFW